MNEKILELLNENNYTEIKNTLTELNDFDIADILNEFDEEYLLKIFRLLNKDKAANVFSYLDIDLQQKLISKLTDKEQVNIVKNLYSDDAVDLLDELPSNVVKKILNNVDKQTRNDINSLLNYPENSAGSIMTVELIDLKADSTVSEALKRIRKIVNIQESIETSYVISNDRILLGSVNLKDIILNQPNKKIKNIMDDNVISVNTHTDQEEVANIMQDYDLTSIPVTDSENRLVGIITIDDIIDILEEETTEDIEKMAAIVPTEKPYLKLSILDIYKSRIPWLLLLMISATFTGKIIQHYEESLATYVILTSFIPMLMNTGGNAGGQSSVTIIRGLSLDEIEFKDTFKIIFKEGKVSILIGITLALVNFLKLILLDKISLLVSLVVSLTIIVTIILAEIIGCILPILAKKLKLDPAVMASPFITTIVDAVSLITYFKIATMLLGI